MEVSWIWCSFSSPTQLNTEIGHFVPHNSSITLPEYTDSFNIRGHGQLVNLVLATAISTVLLSWTTVCIWLHKYWCYRDKINS